MSRRDKYLVSNIPTVERSRSKFDLSHGHKTSATMGYLYPLDPVEVLPGDTFNYKLSMVMRLSSSLIRPVMDNLFIDVHFFYIPKRILFDDFEKMYGQASPNDWTEPEDITLPKLGVRTEGYISGWSQVPPSHARFSVAAHFGLPAGQKLLAVQYENTAAGGEEPVLTPVATEGPDLLPFRAFAKIYNEFFRDQNAILPNNVITGGTGLNEVLNGGPWSPTNYTGDVPKVSKLHDYFTSVLPSPQKGEAVTVPLNLVDDIPVEALREKHGFRDVGQTSEVLYWEQHASGDNVNLSYPMFLTVTGPQELGAYGYGPGQTMEDGYSGTPSNLWAVGGDYASSLTVNDLRFAFQYQKMLEAQARAGSRFVEWLFQSFGVRGGDARLQRPEYLGGTRIPVDIHAVTQTTGFAVSGDDVSSLGEVAGQSVTVGKNICGFSKSFVEPGFIIPVFTIRQFHSYQQGVARQWYKHKRTDFYEPVFANLSEQPVYKYQLYVDEANLGGGDNLGDKPIFGYQEAWAEYRQIPNLITGQMNVGAQDNLDFWHLGDNFDSSVTYGQDFLEETPDNLDRVLAVSSSVQDQFIIDFWENISAVRCLPLYSVPGLIDHH